MVGRISKVPPIAGTGLDMHAVLPPSLPPPPPAPPNPAPIPRYPYAVAIISCAAGMALTGKYSTSCNTEFLPDLLWQYDWGPGQVHIPLPAVVATPSIMALVIGSTTKYFIPSFAIQESVNGAAIAAITGGGAPVGVSTPAFFVPTQQCHDTNCIGFVLPSSICFQLVSTRWVEVNFGDLAAGIIGMAGDALGAALLSKFGGKFMPKTFVDDAILGGLGSTFLGQLSNILGSLPGALNLTGAGSALMLSAMFETTAGVAVLAPLVTWGASKLGTHVGEEYGSTRSYRGERQRSSSSGSDTNTAHQPAPSG